MAQRSGAFVRYTVLAVIPKKHFPWRHVKAQTTRQCTPVSHYPHLKKRCVPTFNSRLPVCAKPSVWGQTTYRVVNKITTGIVTSASMVDTATLAVTSSWATS